LIFDDLMQSASPTRNLRDDLLIVLFFPLLGLLVRLLEVMFHPLPASTAEWLLLPIGYFTWIEWSLLVPLITWFARRSRSWPAAVRLGAHALGAVAAALMHLLMLLAVTIWAAGLDAEGAVALAVERLPRHLVFGIVNYLAIVAALQLLDHWRRSEREGELRVELSERLHAARLRQSRDRLAIPRIRREIDEIIEAIRGRREDARRLLLEVAARLRERLRRLDLEPPPFAGDPEPPLLWSARQRVALAVLLFPCFGLVANALFLVVRPVEPGWFAEVIAALAGWLVAGVAVTPLVVAVDRFEDSSFPRSAQFLLLAFASVFFAVVTDWLWPARVIGLSPAPEGAIAMVNVTLKLLLAVVVVYVTKGAVMAEKLHDQRRESSRLRQSITEANLQMLRAQFRPHFIFNVMSSVASLIRHDPDRAVEMLQRLEDLLDSSIAGDEEVFVTVAAEIESTRRYLELEQIRFGDRLAVAIDSTPDAMEALIPQFLLQPLAENAVRHGVARQAGGGEVRISARRWGGALLVEVENSGVWRDGSQHGIGISNTRSRLVHTFPTDHRFDIHHDSHTVRVSLLIPQTVAVVDGC
jgi:two-component system, LytTR family, sensor kinase